jgi:hypothetical protein
MHNAHDTGRTRAASPPNPSRRAMLAGGTAALLAGAAAVTVARGAPSGVAGADGPDAELIAMCARLVAQAEVVDRIDAEGAALPGHGITPESEAHEERMEVAGVQWWATAEQICGIPARTPSGLHAKAGAMRDLLARLVCTGIDQTLADIETGEEGELEDRMALSLARDVLSGRAEA